MIDPSFAVSGADWMIPAGVGPAQGTPPVADGASSSGSSFGGMLADQIQSLEATQTQAAEASRGVVTGQVAAEDAVMAMERARLSMQLAATIRTKAVDAVQSIFHTQI